MYARRHDDAWCLGAGPGVDWLHGGRIDLCDGARGVAGALSRKDR